MRAYSVLRFLRHFLLALQFFTRIPVTGRLANWVGFSTTMLRASAAHFPGVGWVVGGLTALVFAGLIALLPRLPESVWVAAVLSTVFSVLLTGAFHEDGLADTADGLGGAMTRERALDIMKDSRIGTYGTVALVLAIFAKLSLLVLLTRVDLRLGVATLFLAHVTSRFTPLFLIRAMDHVGDTPQSKSKPLAENISTAAVGVGLVWWGLALLAMFSFLPVWPWWAGALGAAVMAAWMARRLQQRLQGYTGDGLGATQQLSELGFYLGMALAVGIP